MGTRFGALLVSGVLAWGAAPAMAWGGSGVHVSVGGSGVCASWSGHGSSCSTRRAHAGVLVIDGRRTTIPAGPGALDAIAHAFRCAGYQASCQGGRVVVRWSCTRPSVRWLDEAASASLHWSRDCLTVTTRAIACGCSDHRRPSVRVTVRNDWCPPARPHHGPSRRPGWGRHPSWNRCD